MENYSCLVDVKLLQKRINQTATEINFFLSFVLQIAASMPESKVQFAPPAIMAVLTPKSVIQLTVFTAFVTGRKMNYVCCNYVHFSHQPLFLSIKREVFPSPLSNNSHTMHRFIVFMCINQDQTFDDGFDYKCYVKNLLRFQNNNIERERIDKRFKEFWYIGLLKILII